MRFTRHNNPSKRRRPHRLTENEQKQIDEARMLMLNAERNGDHYGAHTLAIALNAIINRK